MKWHIRLASSEIWWNMEAKECKDCARLEYLIRAKAKPATKMEMSSIAASHDSLTVEIGEDKVTYYCLSRQSDCRARGR